MQRDETQGKRNLGYVLASATAASAATVASAGRTSAVQGVFDGGMCTGQSLSAAPFRIRLLHVKHRQPLTGVSAALCLPPSAPPAAAPPPVGAAAVTALQSGRRAAGDRCNGRAGERRGCGPQLAASRSRRVDASAGCSEPVALSRAGLTHHNYFEPLAAPVVAGANASGPFDAPPRA